MDAHSRINEIYLKRALYFYDFDLKDGMVKKDIVDINGVNYTRELGLTSPCSFDELIEKSYSEKQYKIWHFNNSEIEKLNCESLKKVFEAGERLVEASVYLEGQDNYHRISYYLIPEDDGNVHVFASCIDVTADEKGRNENYFELQSEKIEIDEIVASARIGIWHIYLFDGEKPRMNGTKVMYELLGIDPKEHTEEEIYDFWYSRVKRSSLPSVNASVAEMIDKGFSENTYCWKHPVLGEMTVRCGGTSKKIDGRGVVLSGYHSDVTETVNAEIKHQQLLSDALEELKKQKKLLQEALDNYKEADYDRRRDFLTGLRNRQDMFELLQDVLSGKRENINAMFMMDIDNFKLLNDHYGHSYGDECLKKIGDAFNEYAKKHKINFYRYGGEEILGISFNKSKNASDIANELVKLVSGLDLKRDDVATGVVTISLGYTTDNSRYEKMIDKADTAMYKAKGHGKNQAVCFEEI